MLARVRSYLLQGIDAVACEVEVDLDDANLDRRAIVVGLPDAAVKESLERVRAAMANSGYPPAEGRLLVNLAPADLRKEGPVYDLPIAVGMLVAQRVIVPPARDPDAFGAGGLDHREIVFAGELALDGRVRPVRGVLALAAMARAQGVPRVMVPAENAQEASVVEGVDVIGVRTLAEVVGLLSGEMEAAPHPPADVAAMLSQARAPVDFAEVRGQEGVKRAITIAAAGAHNLLMLGPAGTGKTMMAKALPGVLPSLTPAEAIEITRIYSAAGALPPGTGLVTTRPVRTPHHTASSAAIVGGGIVPRPGEISLAHRGVLFLDELAEFPRMVLETLRQPLEDHVVTIARSHAAVKFPASFMLVAAMNPTPKGDVAPGEVGRREMERYLSRLSGPLLDRIDIHVEAPAVPWAQLQRAPTGTSSAQIRDAASRAHERQVSRQGEGVPNARLSGKQLDALAPFEGSAREMLGHAMTELGLSARAYDKIRRVSRTIADLAGKDLIGVDHVAEAIGYRLLDRKV
ncbi:MAG: YifB family Mg chelatase-like AAA ATPase [Phycisphaerales bacterium]|jgi:magnesium chelatase family protein|nr:YifB family Mg chelatase-like AAA ATPase [Phycisphaerales bacterium]